MLVGWGDFRSGELHFDIVSSMPGLRSHDFTRAGIAPLIGYFRDCWVAARQLPCQLDLSGCAQAAGSLRIRMRGKRWLACRRRWCTASATATAAANGSSPRSARRPARRPGAGTALKLLLPFIDTALRRIPPAPARQARCDRSRWPRT